ncbi:hypothetical protein A9Q99_07805 [Gammaproteobacteria bacterium 45_16_T64]|nr:hypothetical protein A9Q99_07805 [Gammaproteobacteria bacterium 45_16_T64]
MTPFSQQTKRTRTLTLLTLLLLAISPIKQAFAGEHDHLFKAAALNHGVSETVLRSICEIESQHNPWAFNVNGEGFQPENLRQAVTQIENIQSRPWLLKVYFGKGPATRIFYKSKRHATQALNDIKQDAKQWGFTAPQNTSIRKLDTRSTDIGYMQINWLFHGRHFDSLTHLYEPATNIDYAARYLKKLIRRHGSMAKAVAFYHSSTQRYQAIYLNNFWPVYQKHILLARR